MHAYARDADTLMTRELELLRTAWSLRNCQMVREFQLGGPECERKKQYVEVGGRDALVSAPTCQDSGKTYLNAFSAEVFIGGYTMSR